MFSILEKVIDTGKGVLDKFVMDKAEKVQLMQEFELSMRKVAMAEDSDFRKFVLDYEGRIADVPYLIKVLRSSVRPVLTYFVVGAYVYGWLNPEVFSSEQMLVLKPAMLLVLGFWFGEKLLSRSGLMDVIGNKKGRD
jgi:hypothetical protein